MPHLHIPGVELALSTTKKSVNPQTHEKISKQTKLIVFVFMFLSLLLFHKLSAQCTSLNRVFIQL